MGNVCDNAHCHARFEGVINNTEATLLRLGPYSPMLNPIENIWSKIKTYVKTHLRVPQVRGIGIVEQRLLYLEKIIDSAKETIVGGDYARAVQHTTIFHAASLLLQDMKSLSPTSTVKLANPEYKGILCFPDTPTETRRPSSEFIELNPTNDGMVTDNDVLLQDVSTNIAKRRHGYTSTSGDAAIGIPVR
nr:unnamed protein product [Callosobruchus analis]